MAPLNLILSNILLTLNKLNKDKCSIIVAVDSNQSIAMDLSIDLMHRKIFPVMMLFGGAVDKYNPGKKTFLEVWEDSSEARFHQRGRYQLGFR